jgi:orotate phosphoribosyltransferase
MRLNQVIAGKIVFLIDDVVTTGATITEAWKTVSLAGAIVAGALVVSEARQ